MHASMWKHWVVRSVGLEKPFEDFACAQWTWARLQKAFPKMIAAVLMPNHLHLIIPDSDEAKMTYQILGGILSGISRRQKKEKLWQPILTPTEIPDRHHLFRQIRYVALNPCRKRLCEDPLVWYWSTYRELFGAAADCADRTSYLARIWGEAIPHQFPIRFHSYVSGDPSVRVEGTPPPKTLISRKFAFQSLATILAASAAALRVHPSEVRKSRSTLRPLFFHLAHRHHWGKLKILSQISGMKAAGIHKLMAKSGPSALGAAEICLGDGRLHEIALRDLSVWEKEI